MLFNNKDKQGKPKPLVSKELIEVIENENNWELIR